MLRVIQHRRIKKVIKLLSAGLIKGYGSRDFFSLGQITASTRECSARQQQIAVALYVDPQDINFEENPTLKLLRNDVSHYFFEGNDYTGQDVLNLLVLGGWKGGRIDDDMSNRFGMGSRY
ncbi:DUF6559 family protein [Photobacterium carnosum]|uniref:DUF6559 family protein n=1 Tax=Photobacterium carnosum TaxID=2023717 RepID=UPI001E481A14|nr:DUF6559 family protein [Photobacterium carnosum]MCD9525694.1 hypothetical protein [Photobacterium carnosum]